jgi:DNA primase
LAGPFPKGFVEVVRNAGDIAHLLSDYVVLRPSGRRLRGLCPFHQEKTPSFYVDPQSQLFYCFGCQTGGDIFKFVMLYEKVDFREAAEMVARRFGVRLPETPGVAAEPRGRLLEMNRVAEEFFRARLQHSDPGSAPRAYLTRRGLGAAIASRLGLGYAPEGWEVLRSHLLARGFKPEEIVKGGLAVPRASGAGQYDRFRERLMFPIRDAGGRTVAFGGRALGEAEPKYLNSPETPVYVKGHHLYGLDLAREAIRREGFAIVVEGYMDVASLLGAGFDNVVASLGTAFTLAQVRLLARFTDRVTLSYDGDVAGAAATTRSVGLLLGAAFQVRVVDLPGGFDPDEFIRQEGAPAFAALLGGAPEYLEYLIRRELRGREIGRTEEQLKVVEAVLPHLAKLPSAIERAGWAGRLADALGLEDALILQELRVAARSGASRIRQPVQVEPARPLRAAEARLLSLVLTTEDARREVALALEDELVGTRIEPVVSAILDLERAGHPVDAPAVLDALEGEGERELVTQVLFRDEPVEGPGVRECLQALRLRRLARQSREEAAGIARLQTVGLERHSVEIDDRLLRVQELARRRDALS